MPLSRGPAKGGRRPLKRFTSAVSPDFLGKADLDQGGGAMMDMRYFGLTVAPVRPDWLALRTEEIVEPTLKIIDAHHHLWDQPGQRYLFDDFIGDIRDGHDIHATVFTQCRTMYRASGREEFRCVGETEFASGVAAQSESGLYGSARACAAIVAFIDFSLGDKVVAVLEAHSCAAGGRLRGVRGGTAWHADDAIHKLQTPGAVLMETRTRSAVSHLNRLGLTLDIWAFQTQMAEVIDLCRAFPALPVIIDHAAGPLSIGPYTGRRNAAFEAWRKDVKTLGALPNTFMKIGGLGMRTMGLEFHLKAVPPSSDDLVSVWRPYVETCVDAFEPGRCMFESNFPVDKATCSYRVLWNAYKKLCAGFSQDEKHQLFFGTAAAVYRLTV